MTDSRTPWELADELSAVLCDPEGTVCIAGSDEDRAIIQRCLAVLRAQSSEPVAWRWRERVPVTLNWGDWRHVGFNPQGENGERFQKEPLYLAAPPAPPEGMAVQRELGAWKLALIEVAFGMKAEPQHMLMERLTLYGGPTGVRYKLKDGREVSVMESELAAAPKGMPA